MSDAGTTVYRWSRAYGLRIFASAAILLGAVWLVSALLDFPRWSIVVLVTLAALTCAALLRLVVVPLPLLVLSASGYRLRFPGRVGAKAAAWTDVDSIARSDGTPTVVTVIRLSDGRSTVVPLSLLGDAGKTAERDMQGRLNAAFGYRRLSDR